MNKAVRTKEHHKKFNPLQKKGTQIIFFDLFSLSNSEFLLFQDSQFEVILWKLTSNAFSFQTSIRIQSMINVCECSTEKKDSIWVGCKSGTIYRLGLKVQDRSSKVTIEEVLRMTKSSIECLGESESGKLWFIDGLSKYFEVDQSDTLGSNIQYNELPNIKHIQQFQLGPSKSLVIQFIQSCLPFFIKEHSVFRKMPHQINSQIATINQYYQINIDQTLDFSCVNCSATATLNSKSIYVIGSENGKISIFQIAQLDAKEQQILPNWLKNLLIPLYDVQIGRNVVQMNAYQEYLSVSTQSRVLFIDLSERKRAFDTLKQKQCLQINKIRWTSEQKIILASLNCNSNKVYLFEKELPIKCELLGMK